MKAVPINEPIKLLTKVHDFSFFAEDQVLTAGQLNRLIQHLDFADRATRAWLIGAGVLCGLTHAREGTTIVLEPGCALTTDGDLLTIEERMVLTHSREFTDEETKYKPLAEFAPFRELVTEEMAAADDSATPLTAARLRDTVVALYLESFTKPPEFCTGDNCDNKGPIQHNNVRVLLLPRAGLDPLPPELPEIAEATATVQLPRPKLTTGIKKLEGNDGLQATFTGAITAARTALTDRIGTIQKEKRFVQAMTLAGFDEAPNLITRLPGRTLNPAAEIRGLTHIYNFFRDFCQAFEEWRQSLYCLRGYCLPAPEEFPKHVLLGEVGRVGNCPRDLFRHPFYRAGTQSCCADALEKSRLLWRRLIAMVDSFDLNTATREVRITPCKGCRESLGNRALPFYYGAEFPGPWDVEARLHCAPDEPPNYHRDPHQRFNDDICRFQFFRIDGHLGMRLADAEARLKQLRAQLNIPFQILSIQIEDAPDFVVLPPIRFFDIETLFHHHVLDLKLKLDDARNFSEMISTEAGKAPETSVPKEKATAVSDASGALRLSATSTREKIPQRFSDFAVEENVRVFNVALTDTVTKGVAVNKVAYDFAKYSPVTPTDRLAQPEATSKFGHLFDLLKNRRRKVQERSIFQKFVALHPGLEHLGGVPAGGTFVLVYSAADTPERRIVKADFSLPYYAALNISDLEEEDPPADIQVNPPPYVFQPRPWKEIYPQWTFTPLTPLYVDAQFAKFQDSLVNVQANIAKNMDLVVNEKIVNGILPKISGIKDTRTGGAVGGLIGNEFYNEVLNILETNNAEISRLREEVRLGIAPPTAGTRMEELEIHNAEILAKAATKVSEVIVEAEKAGQPIAIGDRTMANVIKANAVTIESAKAKTALKTEMQKTLRDHARSPLVKSNFGNLTRIV